MTEPAKVPETAKPEKKPRHRSPNYPAISLRSAVDKIDAVYKEDKLAPLLKITFLKHMGFDKAHAEAARVLSALKSFGLIEEVNERIKLTQRGIDIVARGEMDMQRASALRDAAVSPEVYRQLLEQYQQSGGLPSDAALKSELIAVKRFNPNAVEGFVRDFRDTLDFAGLSDLSVVELPTEEGQNVSQAPMAQRRQHQVQPTPVPPAVTSPPRIPGIQANARQDIFSLPEGVVTIQWPSPLSPESFEDFSAWLDILKRKAGRSVAAGSAGSGKQDK